jgi:UDPglucose 6-dehydrogenase
MRVAMIGSGYVGLVSGACFSEFGHHVICVDKDENRIDALNSGQIPIYEPGLENLVSTNIRSGRLAFSTELDRAVPEADAVFIAVGTPSRRGDGHADLDYVFAATEEIAAALNGYTVVITKSTVPVGTGRRVKELICRLNPDAEFDVVSNPEFLREGSAIEDFQRPDRIICGTESPRARDALRELYRPLYLNETPILFTTHESAELIKYAANGFLATKISFINEMADLCEKLGADVQDVARGIGLDRRIGPKFLNAGPGYGGSCFPKDTLALLRTAEEAGTPSKIIASVAAANDERKSHMAEKIEQAFGGVKEKRIAVLGLTFKSNTDDMRESPSLVILPELMARGATIQAYDPEGMVEAAKQLEVTMFPDAYAALAGADGVILLTEWNEFRALDLAKVKALLKHPLMVDLRNIYKPKEMMEAGFEYISIGRPPSLLEQ